MHEPQLAAQLRALVDPVTRGDPMSLLVWMTKSTRNLAAALSELRHAVSDRTIARMLRDAGFSLQGNAKVVEGTQHEDRDAQFRYLADQVTEHAAAGAPVVSVDAKKKELVGEFRNGGKEYQPARFPERVNVHDFADKHLGKAIPYGIYDLSANTGWVSVGTDHDTAAFVVATLRRWWDIIGKTAARSRSTMIWWVFSPGLASSAGLSVSRLVLPVKDLHTRLAGIAGDRYDLVVVDTPQLAERAGIVLSALRLADLVLVPLAPAMAEFERLGDMWSSIAELEPATPRPGRGCGAAQPDGGQRLVDGDDPRGDRGRDGRLAGPARA